MIKVTTHFAKTNLSKLIAQAEAGEDVVICRGDKPVAVLKALGDAQAEPGVAAAAAAFVGNFPPWDGKSPRQPGRLKGLIHLDDSFFDPLTDEELGLWEDGDVFPDDKEAKK